MLLNGIDVKLMPLPEVQNLIPHLREVGGLPGYSVREPVGRSVGLQLSLHLFITHSRNYQFSLEKMNPRNMNYNLYK